jgi:hypothetical protein
MTKKDRALVYADCSIYYYNAGDIRRAAKYWNRIYSLHLDPLDLIMVMQKFTDQQVYDITDRIRLRYYQAMGYV